MRSSLSPMHDTYTLIPHPFNARATIVTSYKVLAANNRVWLGVEVFPLDSTQPKRALRLLHRDPVKRYPCFPCLNHISRSTVVCTRLIHHFSFLPYKSRYVIYINHISRSTVVCTRRIHHFSFLPYKSRYIINVTSIATALYKEVWNATVGQVPPCQQEHDKVHIRTLLPLWTETPWLAMCRELFRQFVGCF